MKPFLREKPPEKVWQRFKEQETVSEKELEQFKVYADLLSEWNRQFNLTAIRGLSEVVHRHFSDSLVLRKFLDLSQAKLVADVGSGGGFPGIPLKIMFPHLDVILIEVTKKKQHFLRTIIDELGLEGIQVCDLDWRTFLRKTESKVEYFLARASLDPVELCRFLKPGCFYKHAKLIYWATKEWQPEEQIAKFVQEEYSYKLKRAERRLVLMGLPK